MCVHADTCVWVILCWTERDCLAICMQIIFGDSSGMKAAEIPGYLGANPVG